MQEAEFGYTRSPQSIWSIPPGWSAALTIGASAGGKLIKRQMYRPAMFDCLPDGIHSATAKGVSAKIA